MKRLLATVCLLALAGCSTPPDSYVEADRATYNNVAPEYLEYVRNDGSLTTEQKLRRERTVHTWNLRIQSVEGK